MNGVSAPAERLVAERAMPSSGPESPNLVTINALFEAERVPEGHFLPMIGGWRAWLEDAAYATLDDLGPRNPSAKPFALGRGIWRNTVFGEHRDVSPRFALHQSLLGAIIERAVVGIPMKNPIASALENLSSRSNFNDLFLRLRSMKTHERKTLFSQLLSQTKGMQRALQAFATSDIALSQRKISYVLSGGAIVLSGTPRLMARHSASTNEGHVMLDIRTGSPNVRDKEGMYFNALLYAERFKRLPMGLAIFYAKTNELLAEPVDPVFMDSVVGKIAGYLQQCATQSVSSPVPPRSTSPLIGRRHIALAQPMEATSTHAITTFDNFQEPLRALLSERLSNAEERHKGKKGLTVTHFLLDTYLLQRRLSAIGAHALPNGRDTADFQWNARTAERQIGIRTYSQLLKTPNASPTEAAQLVIGEIEESFRHNGGKKDSLAYWIHNLDVSEQRALIYAGVHWSSELHQATNTRPLIAPKSVGIHDPWWTGFGISIRGRFDVILTEKTSPMHLLMRRGVPDNDDRLVLGLSALVFALYGNPRRVPREVIGYWPESGHVLSVRVHQSYLEEVAGLVCDAVLTQREAQ
jgi:hypothetical protein